MKGIGELHGNSFDLLEHRTRTEGYSRGRIRSQSFYELDFFGGEARLKPYHIEEFLRIYAKLLRGAIEQNSSWQESAP